MFPDKKIVICFMSGFIPIDQNKKTCGFIVFKFRVNFHSK